MSSFDAFSAQLRRADNWSRERASLMLYAFLQRDVGGEPTTDRHFTLDLSRQQDADASPMPASVVLIIRYAVFTPLLQFLFALTGTDTVLRSPDLGATWREMSIVTAGGDNLLMLPPNAGEGDVPKLRRRRSEVGVTSQAEFDLGPSAVTDDVISCSAKAPPTTLLCLVCADAFVVVGGVRRFIAVSRNSGVSFSQVSDTDLEYYFTDDEAVRHVCIVEAAAGHILIAGTTQVVSAHVDFADSGHSTLRDVTLIMRCTGPINLLQVTTVYGTQREMIISEPHVLYLSWDDGHTVLKVPHTLGTVRGLTTLDVMRNLERLSLSAAVIDALSAKPGGNPLAPTRTAYASTLIQTLQGTAESTQLKHCMRQVCSVFHGERDIYWRLFFVTGAGTRVMAYDYTCVLCIGFTCDDAQLRVLSMADGVRYVPYSYTPLSQPLPCAVMRVGGTNLCRAARGTACGVSFSEDFVAWSTPKHSTPISLVVAGGGRFIVATQRGVLIVTDGTVDLASHAMAPQLRVSSLTVVVGM